MAAAAPDSIFPDADMQRVLQAVMRTSREKGEIVCGIRSCLRSIESQRAKLVLLADNCTEDAYKKLVVALAAESGIDLARVPDRIDLGEWAGIHRLDKSGVLKKAIGASVVTVNDFGETTPELTQLLGHFKAKHRFDVTPADAGQEMGRKAVAA